MNTGISQQKLEREKYKWLRIHIDDIWSSDNGVYIEKKGFNATEWLCRLRKYPMPQARRFVFDTFITSCFHFCTFHLSSKTAVKMEKWQKNKTFINLNNLTPVSRKCYDDIIKWKHFPRYWPFVRAIHRWPVNYPHKGQWRGALMFSLICAWINIWVNNREAGDLRRHRAHY